MRITDFKINHVFRPICVDGRALFSWISESGQKEVRQKSYRLTVMQKDKTVYESGTILSDRSAGIPCLDVLVPRTRYTAKVFLTNDKGETASALTVFETGKREEPWQASFISSPKTSLLDASVFLFQKAVFLEHPVQSARLYAAAYGSFTSLVNGKQPAEEKNTSGLSGDAGEDGGEDGSSVFYFAYDVTDSLKEGANTLAAAVSSKQRDSVPRGKTPGLLMELHVVFEDHTEAVFGTDDSWDVSENGAALGKAVLTEKQPASVLAYTDCPAFYMREWAKEVQQAKAFHCTDRRMEELWQQSETLINAASGPLPSEALPYVPVTLYRYTGDPDILETYYPAMKQWCLDGHSRAHGGPGFHTPGRFAPKAGRAAGAAVLYHACGETAYAADLLNLKKDAKQLRSRQDKARSEFRKLCPSLDGPLRKKRPALCAAALRFDLLNENDKEKALRSLVKDLENRIESGKGFGSEPLETPYLLEALTDNGQAALAYDLLRRDHVPPLSTSAAAGLEEWICSRAAGITPIEPGFHTFRIAPVPDAGTASLSYRFKTPYGVVCSAWKVGLSGEDLMARDFEQDMLPKHAELSLPTHNTDCLFRLSVTVPCNTSAKVVLPDGQKFSCGSGFHQFSCRLG